MLALSRRRQVLRDDGDVVSFVGEVLGDGEDAVVVVVRRRRGRERGGRLMVQLDAQRAARVVRRQCFGQRTRAAKPFEHAQRLARRPAELGMVPLRLELADHDDRQHHVVLCEAHERERVGEHHRRVEDVRARHIGARGGRIGHGHPIGIRLPRPRSLRRRSCCSAMSLGHMKPPPRPLVVDGSALTGVVERCERRSASEGAATHGLRGRGTQRPTGLVERCERRSASEGAATHGLRGRGTQRYADILVACPACSARSSPVNVPRYVVLDEDDVFAFLDIRPLFPGHTLLVPKAHYETLVDLPQEPDRAAVRRRATTGRRDGDRARRGGIVRRGQQPGESERRPSARARRSSQSQGRTARLLLAAHEVRVGRRGGGHGGPPRGGRQSGSTVTVSPGRMTPSRTTLA